MALILQIDTATDFASICLSEKAVPLQTKTSSDQKNHGSFLQPAILELFNSCGKTLKDLDAIAISEGPGSYTGLRVSMATAKGLCYALSKPLICINTLKIIATSAIEWNKNSENNYLYAPMIDARRMEVFTAIYDEKLNIIEIPNAKILDFASYFNHLKTNKIIFSGSGSIKFQNICTNKNAIFIGIQHTAENMSELAFEAFQNQKFADLAYSEPFYLKSFYTLPSKK